MLQSDKCSITNKNKSLTSIYHWKHNYNIIEKPECNNRAASTHTSSSSDFNTFLSISDHKQQNQNKGLGITKPAC